MEEDILNYSPTVMFRGTPCISARNIYEKEKFINETTFLWSGVHSSITCDQKKYIRKKHVKTDFY